MLVHSGACTNRDRSIDIDTANMHCLQGIACTMGLMSAEGLNLELFKLTSNNSFISAMKIM